MDTHRSPHPRTRPRLSADRDLEPLLLTELQVARLLAVSPKHVWNLSARGELPHVKIGTAKRYHRDDVAAYLRRLRPSAANE